MALYYSDLQPGVTPPAGIAPLSSASQPRLSHAATGSTPVAPPITNTAGQASGDAMLFGQRAASQLPGYSADVANIGSNITSETAGQLPADVIRALQQAGAERGIATGSPGSDNSNAAYLRALGLTSLDLTNMGQKNLTGFLPSLPGYELSQNPNFYVNPEQKYGRDLQSSVFSSAPDPLAAQEAALRAAGSGYGVGRGSGPLNIPGVDRTSAETWMNSPNYANASGGADPSTSGTFIGGQWYPPGAEPGGGDAQNAKLLEDMIANYAPGAGGDLSQEEQDYYQSPAYAAANG